MVALTFRTPDPRWGPGQDEDLSATQIDTNFWLLMQAINDMIASPLEPRQIVSITMDGSQLTFNMSDSTTIGPIVLPVREFHWRGDWEAGASYDELDIFRKAGQGLYLVQISHDAAGTFDENATDSESGKPLYLKMFEFAPAENVVYDMGFFYPGVLKDIPTSIDRLWEEPVVRQVLLPAGGPHRVRMRVAPSTAAQDFILYQNGTNIGTAHVDVGSNEGTVSISSDTVFVAGTDVMGMGRQGSDDAVAAGLSLVLAAQQVVG